MVLNRSLVDFRDFAEGEVQGDDALRMIFSDVSNYFVKKCFCEVEFAHNAISMSP